MTKKMGLMALGLSMVLLSGCGGSSDSDGGSDGGATPSNPNTPAEMEKNIVGTWSAGCVADGNIFKLRILVFNANGSGTYAKTEYSAAGCNANDEVGKEDETFTYKLGEATKGADGEDAVEADVVFGGVNAYYTMWRFDTAGSLYLADDHDGAVNDGKTSGTRVNDFSESKPLDSGSGDGGTNTGDELRALLAGNTLYVGGGEVILESWTFASDLTSSAWQEMVDTDGVLEKGSGCLYVTGMTMAYYDGDHECSSDPTIITVTEILEDYMLISINGEVARLYYDEAKARAYYI